MSSEQYRSTWFGNKNLIVLVSVILAGIGIVWLSLNQISAGQLYTTIFFAGITMMMLTMFFVDESNNSHIRKFVKLPFESDYDVASGMFVLGWLTPLVINFLLKTIGSSFNIAQLMIPLSAQQVLSEISVTSFAIAQTSADPFWKWFVGVFVAGSIEELTFAFILPFIMIVVGYLIWLLMFGAKDSKSQHAKNFYMIFSLISTGLIFGGMHKLNATYVGNMFIVAILFRFAMNWAIYYYGIFLTYTLGFHLSNNAIWYYYAYGATATIEALSSLGGVLVIILLGLIVWHVLRNIDNVARKLKNVLRI